MTCRYDALIQEFRALPEAERIAFFEYIGRELGKGSNNSPQTCPDGGETTILLG